MSTAATRAHQLLLAGLPCAVPFPLLPFGELLANRCADDQLQATLNLRRPTMHCCCRTCMSAAPYSHSYSYTYATPLHVAVQCSFRYKCFLYEHCMDGSAYELSGQDVFPSSSTSCISKRRGLLMCIHMARHAALKHKSKDSPTTRSDAIAINGLVCAVLKRSEMKYPASAIAMH